MAQVLVIGMLCGAMGLAIIPRTRRELTHRGAVSLPLFFASILAFGGLGICTVLAAWQSLWPLPLPYPIAIGFGSIVISAGLGLFIAARLTIRSFRVTWGLETGELVTSGVYRFTRNPQSVGMGLVWLGAAIAGCSGTALLLVALYVLVVAVWILVEEQVLMDKFGDDYRRYVMTVPRYVALQKRTAIHPS